MLALPVISKASPILGSRTVTPADAQAKGIRLSFHEYKDGRIYTQLHVAPEKVKPEIKAVGFAKLMSASYLDEKKAKLIAELGEKLEKDSKGNLAARVILHKDTLANVKVWIEFGHGDGYIHFDIHSFINEWRKNQVKD